MRSELVLLCAHLDPLTPRALRTLEFVGKYMQNDSLAHAPIAAQRQR